MLIEALEESILNKIFIFQTQKQKTNFPCTKKYLTFILNCRALPQNNGNLFFTSNKESVLMQCNNTQTKNIYPISYITHPF